MVNVLNFQRSLDVKVVFGGCEVSVYCGSTPTSGLIKKCTQISK